MSKLNRKGEKYCTKQGYEVEIIKYNGWDDCTIEFNDYNNTVLHEVRYEDILHGKVRNPYHRTIFNVGYFGEGIYKSSLEKKMTKVYDTWRQMFRRCYDEKNQEKQPTYKDVTVDERWHNFQNFAKWFEENYVEGFQLDKDILVKGNKVYSPETCCFVPVEINTLFVKNNKNRGNCPIGVCKRKTKFESFINKTSKQYSLGTFDTPEEAFQVYKQAKEEYIKEIADKWKDKINPKVYKTMYNYKVEITD